MLLLIDNHDSFTYNLAAYFKELGERVHIVKNNALSLPQLAALNPSKLIISPGPGRPEDAGITLASIDYFVGKIPILGVCLGHQAIGVYFGANVILGEKPMHGKLSKVTHDNQGLFKSLPNPIQVVRYHSLQIERSTLPACLTISAQSQDGAIMAIRHKRWPIEGVQFHPEAELTLHGLQLLRQFLHSYNPVLG